MPSGMSSGIMRVALAERATISASTFKNCHRERSQCAAGVRFPVPACRLTANSRHRSVATWRFHCMRFQHGPRPTSHERRQTISVPFNREPEVYRRRAEGCALEGGIRIRVPAR